MGENSFQTRKRPAAVNRRARTLRRGDNMAEALLWEELKDRSLGDYKFVRQMPLPPYYADFACRSHRLIVELDGSQHADSDYDRRRDQYMRNKGYSVLRFWSADVLCERRAICETILAALDGRLSADITAPDMKFTFAGSERREV